MIVTMRRRVWILTRVLQVPQEQLQHPDGTVDQARVGSQGKGMPSVPAQ